METSIVIPNAGLVLLNNYIPVLFDRLGFINEEKKFISEAAQKDAVHYLQYLATGLSNTEERYLPLNKLMCGLSLTDLIPSGISINAPEQELMNGMISAVIAHWSVIGESSIDGFRGNWLVRDGMLTEEEDSYELQVEKRAYDLLINRSPFSFSTIKYPWMTKPINVKWPY